MKKSIKSIVFALGIGCMSLSAPSAAPLSTDNLQGVSAQNATLQKVQYYRDERHWGDRRDRDDWRDDGWRRPHHHGYWRYCERLRRACEFKEERGEVGMGNCRRYKEECGGRGRW